MLFMQELTGLAMQIARFALIYNGIDWSVFWKWLLKNLGDV